LEKLRKEKNLRRRQKKVLNFNKSLLLSVVIFYRASIEEVNFLQQLKSSSPACTRAKNNSERREKSQLWGKNHKQLEKVLNPLVVSTLSRKNIKISNGFRTLFQYFPFGESSPLISVESSLREVRADLNRIAEENSRNLLYNCRRFSSEAPVPLHMGFYEQNLPDSNRIWKLYDTTDIAFLQRLKPVLQRVYQIFRKSIPVPLPCPEHLGLFGTPFTTVVVNFGDCHWHLDPKDKFAILLYFGDFEEGNLALGPPIKSRVPVQEFDCGFLLSGEIYHKVFPYKGVRINISCYSKKTSEFSQKGKLIPERKALSLLVPK
jgi:hypothetical protein